MIPSTIVPAKEIEISAVVCYRVVFDLGSGGGAAVGLAVAGKMGDLGPTHEIYLSMPRSLWQKDRERRNRAPHIINITDCRFSLCARGRRAGSTSTRVEIEMMMMLLLLCWQE